jgi:hypothetical protein
MKACEALIAWTPACETDNPTCGQVKVGPVIREHPRDWTEGYSSTGGAAYTRVRNLRGAASVAQIFIDFHSMVVRDGIDPKVAHRAFLEIDEYAECISNDIEGSRNGDLLL